VLRYEYERPGDLLHLDIKKLGRFCKPGHRATNNREQASRGAGWEFVHVAIDDASRIAFTSLHPDERGSSACQRAGFTQLAARCEGKRPHAGPGVVE
jgi:hypothetical protein